MREAARIEAMARSSIPIRPVTVHGYGGVVVSPHSLATAAGLATLARGGGAVDAAIATNAAQGVVAPETCGIGGDLFALVHLPGEPIPICLNASGRAGSGADRLADDLRSRGFDEIPQHHPAAVTIPGCVDGWIALHSRCGRLPLEEVLEPAIMLAKGGFPASREFAAAFAQRREELVNAIPSLYRQGQAHLVGDRVVRTELAASLEDIGRRGREALYLGERGRSIVEAVDGAITVQDLERVQADWVPPLGRTIFGVDGWTVPPNSQGYISLLTLAILERLGLDDPEDPLSWHLSIESYRAAAADRGQILADSDLVAAAPASLVSDRRVEAVAGTVSRDRRSPRTGTTRGSGGTAYMCVVDSDGVGVSLIQSNYYGIGSGIVVAGAGFILHDRGRGFTLETGHPNTLAVGRRPAHTLSPTLWTRDGGLLAIIGTRGGDQQPQLVSQLASLLLGHGLDPGSAMAFPRWVTGVPGGFGDEATVEIEPGAGPEVVAELERRGHRIEQRPFPMGGWGPMSAVTVGPDGLRTGVADPRVDTAMAAVL